MAGAIQGNPCRPTSKCSAPMVLVLVLLDYSKAATPGELCSNENGLSFGFSTKSIEVLA